MRGRAVIVANIGGLSEVAGDGGLKFPPGDSGALAECIRTFVEDPDLRAELGERARARAQTLFKQERMVEEHLRVFGSVEVRR